MKRIIFAAATLALLVVGTACQADEPAALVEPRQFDVEFRIIDASSGKQQVQLCPKVTVFEHQRVSIVDQVQRPFVIAASPAGGNAQQPHIVVLPEGLAIDLACHANGTGSVTLDVTIEQPKIVDVDEVKVDAQTTVQQPRVEIAKSRHFAICKSGQPLTIALDGRKADKSKRWAEFVVREIHSESN
ncbi:MAG: hypothetical protein WD872_14535 [Pirellulaceae bacterium]